MVRAATHGGAMRSLDPPADADEEGKDEFVSREGQGPSIRRLVHSISVAKQDQKHWTDAASRLVLAWLTHAFGSICMCVFRRGEGRV